MLLMEYQLPADKKQAFYGQRSELSIDKEGTEGQSLL